jgi:hypothetical protein
MKLQKATRKQVKLRLNLSAPSGAGKTFSALLMAYGITGDWKKIAVIDTENGSASLYSHLGDFQTLNLEAPYTPERYIEAIQCCQDAEMEVIIIDSSSHEWSGAGGCIEINEKLAQLKYKGNTWSAWNETTPRHDAFVQKVLQCDVHVITCTRSKMETVMGEGKKVHKVGMKDIQRDGWEYELTVSLSIDRDTHMATPSKDRTGLFEGNDSFIITQDTGKRIIEWCNSGKSIEESKVEEEIEFKKRYDSGLELALLECNNSKDLISLTAVWNSFKMYQKDELFLSTIKEKKVFLTFTNPAENVA